MDQTQKDVNEFHEKHSIVASEYPRMASSFVMLLRGSLLVEEVSEFLAAGRRGNLTDTVDALADIIYVAYGAASILGVDLEPILREVHRSNMTKQGRRDSGGKILKGDAFEPPRIGDELKAQVNEWVEKEKE